MVYQTGIVYKALMKKGYIDRETDIDEWKYFDDSDVQKELEVLGDTLGFTLISSGTRVYLVVTTDNDLFQKTNIDFRKDIKAQNDVRRFDLYLLNYLSIYLIYVFYHGEGQDARCRDFISKEDFIKEFTEHCRATERGAEENEDISDMDYSDNFIQLSSAWLNKLEGEPDSTKLTEKYGALNRILIRFNSLHEDLFNEDNGIIRPSRKLNDLMPYFLRKDRIYDINDWIKEVSEYAEDQ